jgi:hypothetical protein
MVFTRVIPCLPGKKHCTTLEISPGLDQRENQNWKNIWTSETKLLSITALPFKRDSRRERSKNRRLSRASDTQRSSPVSAFDAQWVQSSTLSENPRLSAAKYNNLKAVQLQMNKSLRIIDETLLPLIRQI